MFYLDVWVVHDQRRWHLQGQVIVLPPVQHEGDTLLSNHLTQRQIWRQKQGHPMIQSAWNRLVKPRRQIHSFHPRTMNPHLQVSSDPADQVGRRSLLAALGRHRLVSADLQQQHLVQHHLPQLRGELSNELQAEWEKLPCVSKVLRGKGKKYIFQTGWNCRSNYDCYLFWSKFNFHAHLYWNAVESFGHEDVDQVLCQVVFNAEDHVDVVWRNLPLCTQTQRYFSCFCVYSLYIIWIYLSSFTVRSYSDAGRERSSFRIYDDARLLNSDLTVDPPEGSFSHAVEFDEDLPDPARLQ